MHRYEKTAIVAFLTLLLSIPFAPAGTAIFQENAIGKVSYIQGRVDVFKRGTERAVSVRNNENISIGDMVRTKSNSKAEITFVDRSILRLAPNTVVEIEEYLLNDKGKRKGGIINLNRGKIRAMVSRAPKSSGFVINTPNASSQVKGSDIFAFYQMQTTGLLVVKGSLSLAGAAFPEDIINVPAGKTVIVPWGERPRPPRFYLDVERKRHEIETSPPKKTRLVKQKPVKTILGMIKAEVVKVTGRADFAKSRGAPWKPLKVKMKLGEKAVIRTHEMAEVVFSFGDRAAAVLHELSEVSITSLYSDKKSFKLNIGLRAGRIWNRIDKPLSKGSSYIVNTPAAIAAVRGTRFFVESDAKTKNTRIGVWENSVEVTDAGKSAVPVKVTEGWVIEVIYNQPPSPPYKMMMRDLQEEQILNEKLDSLRRGEEKGEEIFGYTPAESTAYAGTTAIGEPGISRRAPEAAAEPFSRPVSERYIFGTSVTTASIVGSPLTPVSTLFNGSGAGNFNVRGGGTIQGLVGSTLLGFEEQGWGTWEANYGGFYTGPISPWFLTAGASTAGGKESWLGTIKGLADRDWSAGEISGAFSGYRMAEAGENITISTMSGNILGTYDEDSTWQAAGVGTWVEISTFNAEILGYDNIGGLDSFVSIPITETYTSLLTGTGTFDNGGTLAGTMDTTLFTNEFLSHFEGVWTASIEGTYTGPTGNSWNLNLGNGGDTVTITGAQWSGGEWQGKVTGLTGGGTNLNGAAGGTYDAGNFSGVGSGTWETPTPEVNLQL